MQKILMKNTKAFTLVPAILITLLLLVIGMYFLTSASSEKKISESYAISQQAYYLSESGIEYAIWKLKNDETWQTSFETDPNWQEVLAVEAASLFSQGSFDIEVKNYDNAEAIITATSTLIINDKESQRVIESQVFKALGTSSIGDNAMLSHQDIDIENSDINITEGSLMSNGDIELENSSILSAENAVQAVDDIIIDFSSEINAPEIHASNLNPPAPESMDLPAISFNDPHDPEALKELAQAQGQVYSHGAFDSMLSADPNLILNGVVYITGNIEIETGEHLTVNGVLACSGNITIGTSHGSCTDDDASITINAVEGEPSGLFTKSKIDIEECVEDIEINGILYAHNSINIDSLNADFSLTGSMMAKSIEIENITNDFTLNFDNTIVQNSLFDETSFSPIISIGYWEEEF